MQGDDISVILFFLPYALYPAPILEALAVLLGTAQSESSRPESLDSLIYVSELNTEKS